MTTATTNVQQRLRALRHHETLYEIEMALPDGRRCLLAYSGRRSMRGILKAIWNRSDHVMRVAGVGPDAPLQRAGREWRMESPGGTVVFRFTGRTQRDAIASGREMPYVGNMAA